MEWKRKNCLIKIAGRVRCSGQRLGYKQEMTRRKNTWYIVPLKPSGLASQAKAVE